MADKNVTLDYGTLPITSEKVTLDYSGIPTSAEDTGLDYNTMPNDTSALDYATMPTPKEFSVVDTVKSAVKNVGIPGLGGMPIEQIQKLAQADQDTQDLIKLGVKYPFELINNQITEEQMQDVRGQNFTDIIGETYPGLAESPSTAKQFGLLMSGDILDWGARPSTWVAMASMKAFSGPLFNEAMGAISKKYPRLHKVLTKEFFPDKQKVLLEKLARGEKLNVAEQSILEKNLKTAQEAASKEIIKERTKMALGQKARQDPALRAKLRSERATPEKPVQRLALPAPQETTPITNTPIQTYDSRVSPIEVPGLVKDADGKPITLGMDEVGAVVETDSGSSEVITVSMESEFAKALKSVIAKVEEYVSRGQEPPSSLIKRQNAFLEALNITGKAGKPVPANKILGVVPPEKIVASEKSLLKERIRTLARGYREGKRVTVDQVKNNIQALKDVIRDSDLVPNDKIKFQAKLTDIANLAKPEVEFKKTVLDVQRRIQDLENLQERRVLGQQISKELRSTKPVKQGVKKVAKYDYENNKLFNELRDLLKLTKADAQLALEEMPTMDLDKADIIKTRLLSYVANGMESSVELRAQILEDIRALKELGLEAKSEELFQKALVRQEAVETAEQQVLSRKGDKDSFLANFSKFYIRGFSNMYSALNAIGGPQMAIKYDPETLQLNRDTAVYFTVKALRQNAAEALGLANVDDLAKAIGDMIRVKFELTDTDGRSVEIDKDELIDIYNSVKNPVDRDRYYNSFGKEQVTELLNNLTDAEMQYGDALVESLTEYWSVYNDYNIEITGRDLGSQDPYWPATSEYKADVFDEIKRQSQLPTAIKKKSKSTKIMPRPKSAWQKVQNHITQGEHVKHVSRRYEELKRLFTSRPIRLAVTKKFGEDIYKNMLAKIENISLNKAGGAADSISNMGMRLLNNWTASKIALNPSTYLRQLVSVINYAESMPTGTWSEEFVKGITSPKETGDYMKKSAPWLEARYNKGYSEAIQRAIKEVKGMNVTDNSWTKGLTILSRMGDITAIIYGGYPYVKWLQTPEGGGLSEEAAFEKFKEVSIKSQQSPLSSGLSDFQNSKSFGSRVFLRFKNTANQYFRKGVDATINLANGDISEGEWAKKMAIYWLANPILYAAVGTAVYQGTKALGSFVREEDVEIDPADIFIDIISQVAISPVAAIPGIDDLVEYAVRKIAGKDPQAVFKLPIFSDIEYMVKLLNKKEPTFKDWIETLGTPAELSTGLPIKTALRYYDYFTGADKKKKRKAVQF